MKPILITVGAVLVLFALVTLSDVALSLDVTGQNALVRMR